MQNEELKFSRIRLVTVTVACSLWYFNIVCIWCKILCCFKSYRQVEAFYFKKMRKCGNTRKPWILYFMLTSSKIYQNCAIHVIYRELSCECNNHTSLKNNKYRFSHRHHDICYKISLTPSYKFQYDNIMQYFWGSKSSVSRSGNVLAHTDTIDSYENFCKTKLKK